MMNTKKAPTDDVHIRKALSYACDYEQMKSILGGVSCVVMVLVLFFQMSMPQAVILVIITIVGILFAQLRYRSGAVKPVKSYEKL